MLKLLRIFMALFSISATASVAQERIALVVGNSNYQAITQLDNPSRDAKLIADALETRGFKVTLLIDADLAQLKRGVSQFGRDLRAAGKDATGLFYYAGHGVQSFGTNYLLPTDAALTDAADLDLVSIEAGSVLRQMFSAKNRTNIVILDACRNNPFQNISEFNDNGLAEMKAPTGTFLSYATAPGGVALDGLDGNSPYTKALAREILVPGLKLEETFKAVRVAVLKETGGRQTPWDTSSLTNDFTFTVAEAVDPEALAEQQLWDSVQATRDPVQIMLFLRAYPDSSFGTDARTLLNQVMEAELSGTTPAVEKPAPAPTRQGPSDREQALFEQAQASADLTGYQSYLREFPQGLFSEFARTEVAALQAKAATPPAPAPQVAATPAAPQTATAPTAAAPVDVRFMQPLTIGDPAIVGKTIAQIIDSSPIFPPVEGLPEEYWKTKKCSNCHTWKQDNLCEQAQVYIGENSERSLDKRHPFGGSFKNNLQVWAQGGCR